MVPITALSRLGLLGPCAYLGPIASSCSVSEPSQHFEASLPSYQGLLGGPPLIAGLVPLPDPPSLALPLVDQVGELDEDPILMPPKASKRKAVRNEGTLDIADATSKPDILHTTSLGSLVVDMGVALDSTLLQKVDALGFKLAAKEDLVIRAQGSGLKAQVLIPCQLFVA
ncbi:hypothetical protein Cni_G19639 [Canna indica]|uniref:Uncharacterized protein n=1 Tax=Canna indica TaxID=4628 RepID=A0AAQ3KMN9_9LILI|nr:hypothetical protein Cni_G19639 [Canna indica]